MYQILFSLLILFIQQTHADNLKKILIPAAKHVQLNIEIESPGRCYVADLDLIKAELYSDLIKRNRIIATIEPLPNSIYKFNKSIAQILEFKGPSITELLVKNFLLTYPQDLSDNPVVAGLFICKDGDNDGSCANNNLDTFKNIASQYRIPASEVDLKSGKIVGRKLERKKVQDNIYFFRPLILKRDELLLPDFNNQSEYNMMYNLYSPKDNKSAVFVYDSSQALGSVPLDIQNEKIILKLPHYDADKCQAKPQQTE